MVLQSIAIKAPVSYITSDPQDKSKPKFSPQQIMIPANTMNQYMAVSDVVRYKLGFRRRDTTSRHYAGRLNQDWLPQLRLQSLSFETYPSAGSQP